MSSARRKLLQFRKPAVVEVGCCCRRTRLSRIFSPKPKSRMGSHLKPSLPHHSSSSSWERSAPLHRNRRLRLRLHDHLLPKVRGVSPERLLEARRRVPANRRQRGGGEGVGRPLPGLPALHSADDRGEGDIRQGGSERAPPLPPLSQFSLQPSSHCPRLYGDLEWPLLYQELT